MTITPEQLAAYVDGECDAAEARRIELAAEQDHDLAQRIAAERKLREQLQAHFAPVGEEPLPAGWEALIRSASTTSPAVAGGTVIDLSVARARRARETHAHGRPWPLRAWMGGAIAASLVLGLVLGMQLRNGGPIVVRNGELMAGGNLAQALDTQLASAQENAPVRVLMTFRSADGTICRAFSAHEASGIACREQGNWQLRHVLPGTPEATTEYRQAGSPHPELSTLAEAMAAGEAFDAKQELAARQHGWR